MSKFYILKPLKLDLKYLVNKYQPEFKFDFEKAHLILHIIIILSSEKNNLKAVPLASKMLESLIGKDYHRYMRFLCENFSGDGNVLHRFPYSEGVPFSYKITQYYYNDGYEIIEICNYKLINKFKELLVNKSKNEAVRLNYSFLYKHFKNSKLTVSDYQKAIHETNQLHSFKRLRNAKSIINVLNGNFKLSLNTKSDGRIHSNITRLSKINRKYLEYNSEKLAEVDISSAVPFFLFISMNLYLDSNLTYLVEFQYSKLFAYMFDEVMGDIDKAELDSFGRSVISGELYEQFRDSIFEQKIYDLNGKDFAKVEKYYQYHFKEQFGYKFDGCLDELKKFAKKRFLSMLFASTSSYSFEQIVFKSLYPTIFKFINEYKNVTQYKDYDGMKWEKKESHKKLSSLCFQFEAKVMIDNIARKFDKLYKGKVAIYTLHDALITTESNVEQLREFMQDEFMNLFGISPKLNIKYYAENEQKIAS